MMWLFENEVLRRIFRTEALEAAENFVIGYLIIYTLGQIMKD
jgi:hypothetical protein